MSKIINWLLGIERHAVDSIVADFNSISHRLRDAADHHVTVAEKAAAEALNLNGIEATARAEAERAKIVAQSIEALVNPTV